MRFLAVSLITLLLSSSACGPAGDHDGTDAGQVEPIEFVAPELEQVAPVSMALGDTIQVFGTNFLPSQYGTTTLQLSGVYIDDAGDRHQYDGEVPLRVKNVSVASFDFDDLIFLPAGDRVGVFNGNARVQSELDEAYRSDDIESVLQSPTISVALTVEPSIAVMQLRSVSESNCSLMTKGTIGEQAIALSVKAIGFAPATPEEPTRFRVKFLAPSMKAVYVKNDAYDLWPIPDLKPTFAKVAASGEARFDAEITEGNQLDIDPTWRQQKVTISPAVSIGGQSFNEVLLGRFETGSKATTVGIIVEATRPDGTTTSREIAYDINEEWEIQSYDQNVRLMERSSPVPVCGCNSGGDIGRDLTYSDGSSVTKSRSFSFRWDRNVANTLGVNAGLGGLLPVQMGVNVSSTFSETFGVDENETISSETHVGVNFAARIIPGYFGTCYRQVDRIEREVDVIYNNACGNSGIIGTTILTDWNFGFDIATGPTCNAKSDLEAGGNYEPDGIQY